MSTRAQIIFLHSGKHLMTYCHQSGYPEGLGQILQDHYATPGKVLALFAMGSFSQIGPTPMQCVAHRRDWNRTGPDTFASMHENLEAACKASSADVEFLYLGKTRQRDQQVRWSVAAVPGWYDDGPDPRFTKPLRWRTIAAALQQRAQARRKESSRHD